MKNATLTVILTSFLFTFILISCNKNNLKELENKSTPAPSYKTFSYADAPLDTAMVFIEEVVNHDEGNASHVYTDMIIDSVAYSFSVTPITVNGVSGLSAAEQQRIKDSVLVRTRNYPSRVDTTLLNDPDLVFVDISGWELNGNTLSFWGNSGIGDLDPNYLGADCQAPKPYTSNDYWNFDLYGNGGGCKTNPATTSSASLEMEKRLNYMKSAQCNITPCINSIAYYSNIEVIPDLYPYGFPSSPDPTGAFDGYMDHLLFATRDYLRGCATSNPADCICLSPVEMEYHTNGAIHISYMSSIRPNTSLVPFYYDLKPRLLRGELFPKIHTLSITYGKIKCQ